MKMETRLMKVHQLCTTIENEEETDISIGTNSSNEEQKAINNVEGYDIEMSKYD